MIVVQGLWLGDLGDGGNWVFTQDGNYNLAKKPDTKKPRTDQDPTVVNIKCQMGMMKKMTSLALKDTDALLSMA